MEKQIPDINNIEINLMNAIAVLNKALKYDWELLENYTRILVGSDAEREAVKQYFKGLNHESSDNLQGSEISANFIEGLNHQIGNKPGGWIP
jgi:hypothetical protein